MHFQRRIFCQSIWRLFVATSTGRSPCFPRLRLNSITFLLGVCFGLLSPLPSSMHCLACASRALLPYSSRSWRPSFFIGHSIFLVVGQTILTTLVFRSAACLCKSLP